MNVLTGLTQGDRDEIEQGKIVRAGLAWENNGCNGECCTALAIINARLDDAS
jgi:hypothetical protein